MHEEIAGWCVRLGASERLSESSATRLGVTGTVYDELPSQEEPRMRRDYSNPRRSTASGRFTRSERALIEALAAQHGLNVSELVRDLLLRAVQDSLRINVQSVQGGAAREGEDTSTGDLRGDEPA